MGTALPVSVGVQGTVELPYRLLLRLDLGWQPRPYANLIDAVLVGVGAYDELASELVRAAWGNGLALGARAGWRPFPAWGFELLAGYTVVALGGGLSAREVIEAASGQQLPDEVAGAEIPLGSTLHNIHLELGYRWVLARHWVIGASAAYLHTVASSSGIEAAARRPAARAAVSAINDRIDAYLDDIYTSYVHTPVLGLYGTYRLQACRARAPFPQRRGRPGR